MSRRTKVRWLAVGLGITGLFWICFWVVSAGDLKILAYLPEALTPPYAIRSMVPILYKFNSAQVQTIAVSIQVNTTNIQNNYLVSELVPDTWTVNPATIKTNFSESGIWDPGCSINCPAAGISIVKPCIKWGPFSDNMARTLTYQITVPINETGDKTFAGAVFYDAGSCFKIEGQQIIGGTTTTSSSTTSSSTSSLRSTTTTSTSSTSSSTSSTRTTTTTSTSTSSTRTTSTTSTSTSSLRTTSTTTTSTTLTTSGSSTTTTSQGVTTTTAQGATTTTTSFGTTTTSWGITTTSVRPSSTTTTSSIRPSSTTTTRPGSSTTSTTLWSTSTTFPLYSTTSTSFPFASTTTYFGTTTTTVYRPTTSTVLTTTTTTLPGPVLPDLQMIKTHNLVEFRAGQEATYFLTVRNSANARGTASTVSLMDPLPAGMTYSSFTAKDWKCTNEGQVVKCNYPNPLPPNTETSLQLKVKIDPAAGGGVQNIAMADCPEGDAYPPNNIGTDWTEIIPLPVTTSTSTTTTTSKSTTTTKFGATTTSVRTTTTSTTTTIPSITGYVLPSSGRYSQQTEFLVNLVVDMTQMGTRKLGSVNGELKWDPGVLQLMASVQDPANGFTGYDNLNAIAQGRLTFSASNPAGSGGSITIRQIRFLAIGAVGSYSSIDMSFSALTESLTFSNLLPFVKKINSSQAVIIPSKMIGDVDCNYAVNNLDALMIYQQEVLLPAPAGCMECGNADGDPDNKVNSADANLIMSFDSGIYISPIYPINTPCTNSNPNKKVNAFNGRSMTGTLAAAAGTKSLTGSSRILQGGAGIRAYLRTGNQEINYLEKVTLEFMVDTGTNINKLGSFTAAISWDATKLRYLSDSPGTTPGIAQVSNRVGNRLLMSGGSISGAGGPVSLRKIDFEFLIDSEEDTYVDLKVGAMASSIVSGVFEDLLPGLAVSGISLRATYRIQYPYLTAGADGGNTNHTHTGIAAVNLGTSSADLTFTAYNPDGTLFTASGISNPMTILLAPKQQLPRVDFQVFGEGLLRLGKFTGWFNLRSTSRQVLGFFLLFDDELNFLDGTDVSGRLFKSLIFTAVGEQGTTQLCAANPGGQATQLTIEAVRSDGGNKAVAARSVPAHGSASEVLTSLIPGITFSPTDYFKVTSGTAGISALEMMILPGKYQTALNGQNPESAATLLYAPQYAVGGGNWRTTLSIVNVDSQPGTVTVRMIADDGTPVGQSPTLPIPARGKIFISDQNFLVNSNAGLVQGYLEINGNGNRLLGNVFFGDPEQQRFASSLPFVSQLQSSLVFAHIASSDTYFMGLALLNPNGYSTATAEIRVFSNEGLMVAQKSVALPSRTRQSLVLTEHFPELLGRQVNSGYVMVLSDTPIAGYAVYGTHSLNVLSAIPAQVPNPTP